MVWMLECCFARAYGAPRIPRRGKRRQRRIETERTFGSTHSFSLLSLCSRRLRGEELFSAKTNRARRRVRFDVADAHVPAADADLLRDAKTFAAELNFGLAAGLGQHFDIGPGDAASPAGP